MIIIIVMNGCGGKNRQASWCTNIKWGNPCVHSRASENKMPSHLWWVHVDYVESCARHSFVQHQEVIQSGNKISECMIGIYYILWFIILVTVLIITGY